MVSSVKTANQKNLIQMTKPVLTELLGRVPRLTFEFPHQPRRNAATTGIIEVHHQGRTYILLLEAQLSAEPRFVRASALGESARERKAHGVLIAPWISPESRGILEQAGLGYLDLAGNARLAFGSVYIERLGAPAPKVQQRELRSLWKPAAARILRALLREPNRDWNLLQLADAAQVSHAHVHKVKTELQNREWLEEHGKGRFKTVRLRQPAALLEAWRQAYQPNGQRTTWYTMKSREEIEHALLELELNLQITLAGFSAARQIAPYARNHTEFLYASADHLERLVSMLELQPVERGENIVVFLEPDEGVFLDALTVSGLPVTGLAQTYLDLSLSGNRGAEAAQHLLDSRIRPTWEKQ